MELSDKLQEKPTKGLEGQLPSMNGIQPTGAYLVMPFMFSYDGQGTEGMMAYMVLPLDGQYGAMQLGEGGQYAGLEQPGEVGQYAGLEQLSGNYGNKLASDQKPYEAAKQDYSAQNPVAQYKS